MAQHTRSITLLLVALALATSPLCRAEVTTFIPPHINQSAFTPAAGKNISTPRKKKSAAQLARQRKRAQDTSLDEARNKAAADRAQKEAAAKAAATPATPDLDLSALTHKLSTQESILFGVENALELSGIEVAGLQRHQQSVLGAKAEIKAIQAQLKQAYGTKSSTVQKLGERAQKAKETIQKLTPLLEERIKKAERDAAEKAAAASVAAEKKKTGIVSKVQRIFRKKKAKREADAAAKSAIAAAPAAPTSLDTTPEASAAPTIAHEEQAASAPEKAAPKKKKSAAQLNRQKKRAHDPSLDAARARAEKERQSAAPALSNSEDAPAQKNQGVRDQHRTAAPTPAPTPEVPHDQPSIPVRQSSVSTTASAIATPASTPMAQPTPTEDPQLSNIRHVVMSTIQTLNELTARFNNMATAARAGSRASGDEQGRLETEAMRTIKNATNTLKEINDYVSLHRDAQAECLKLADALSRAQQECKNAKRACDTILAD